VCALAAWFHVLLLLPGLDVLAMQWKVMQSTCGCFFYVFWLVLNAREGCGSESSLLQMCSSCLCWRDVVVQHLPQFCYDLCYMWHGNWKRQLAAAACAAAMLPLQRAGYFGWSWLLLLLLWCLMYDTLSARIAVCVSWFMRPELWMPFAAVAASACYQVLLTHNLCWCCSGVEGFSQQCLPCLCGLWFSVTGSEDILIMSSIAS
jgi:hypothetical protein